MECKPTIKVIGPNIGFFSIIGAILVTLKLCHVIDCSWWIVLLPFYLPWCLFFSMCIIAYLLASAALRMMIQENDSKESDDDRLIRQYKQGIRK